MELTQQSEVGEDGESGISRLKLELVELPEAIGSTLVRTVKN
jgi:hypothetical protein